MNFREKIKAYFRHKPLRLISDFVFIALLLMLLIPSTRSLLLSGVASVRTAVAPVPGVKGEPRPLSADGWNTSLTGQDGREVLLSEFRGQVIFLNQWATWCPPCRAEMPSIQKLYNGWKEQVVFIFLTQEDPSVVQQFMVDKGYDLPVYYGRIGGPELASRSIPATAVISREGKVAVWKAGAYNWNSGKVRKLLAQMVQ